MTQLTFGSLFAGIGGFDLGFERAGFECRWQVEIDNYATKILEKHWPKVHRERDIRECNANNLERVDCIIGGFPCQDISYAGRGAGLDGERSGLFFEAIRLVRELQPRAIVLENVAALLTRGLDRVLGTLAEIGYDAEWHCIPAAAVGAPHIRDRVFVIAIVADSQGKQPWDVSKNIGTGCHEVNSFNDTGGNCGGDDRPSNWTNVADTGRKLRQSRGVSRSRSDKATIRVKEASDDQRCSSDAADAECKGLEKWQRTQRQRTPSATPRSDWWAVEPAICRVANGIPARVDRLRCLGNAIVPQVAEVVARMSLDRLQSIAIDCSSFETFHENGGL